MKNDQKVLVVDDELSIRRQLSVGLMQRGYDVDDCEKGVSALERLEAARRAGSPHTFVVLDIRLPDIDGLELLRIIKSIYPDLPVVVISGYGDEQTEETVKDGRGSAYFDKPFDLDDLEAEILRTELVEKKVRPRPRITPEVREVQSAYVFLRGKPDADLSGIFTRLYFAEGVCYCDAVIGGWDLVLLAQARDRKGIDEFVRRTIAPIAEIDKYEVHFSEQPALGDDLQSFIRNYEMIRAAEGGGEETGDKRNRQLLSAYALLEIESSCLVSLYTRFYFDENVVYCDTTDGCQMIVLLLQGRTFDEIRKVVSRLQSRPGVLRAKVLHIMQILAM